MPEYPLTPSGWTVEGGSSVGPFRTHVTWRRPDGGTTAWSSRAHRKHASKLSRPTGESVWWAPRRASWWIAALFAVGSTCFLVGPLPGFVELVGSAVDGVVFFVGSIFFTSAALLQWLETINADPGPEARGEGLRVLSFEPRRPDWWASGVQLIGTLFFNVMTFRAMQTALDDPLYNRLVWAPDLVGSICFLAAGYVAYVEVCGGYACWRQRSLEWKIAMVNLLGCIAFMISAVAAYIVPSTGNALDLAAANSFTALGGACFLVGAVLLLPESAREMQAAPDSP